MKPRLLCLLLVLGMAINAVSAQTLKLETYQISVVTKTGERTRGILQDVTATALYCGPYPLYDPRDDAYIPLETIRKITIRRTNKRLALQTGAALGAIAIGFLSVDGLKNNPTSSPVTYGITVLFAAGAGAGVGLLAGSLVGNLNHRVIRARAGEAGLNDLQRQLEPFSARYQNDIINRTVK